MVPATIEMQERRLQLAEVIRHSHYDRGTRQERELVWRANAILVNKLMTGPPITSLQLRTWWCNKGQSARRELFRKLDAPA